MCEKAEVVLLQVSKTILDLILRTFGYSDIAVRDAIFRIFTTSHDI